MRLLALAVGFSLLACARSAAPAAVAAIPQAEADTTAFAAGVYAGTGGMRLAFRLLAPTQPVPGRRYPLVVQFHGSGAIGTDNQAQLGAFARAWNTPEARARFPAYVLVPQFPSRTAAYRVDSAGGEVTVSRALPPLTVALELVDSLRRVLPVDTTRVYAVGFSMGGSSVWHALLERPRLFAGAISIAGVPPDMAGVQRLPRVSLLLVHGTADMENPFASTRWAYDALSPAARASVEFRAYPGLEHEIPTDVLAGHWWREWLFRQHR